MVFYIIPKSFYNYILFYLFTHMRTSCFGKLEFIANSNFCFRYYTMYGMAYQFPSVHLFSLCGSNKPTQQLRISVARIIFAVVNHLVVSGRWKFISIITLEFNNSTILTNYTHIGRSTNTAKYLYISLLAATVARQSFQWWIYALS